MAGRGKLVAQGVAVAGVVALLALLVWKVVAGDSGGAAARLEAGDSVAAPALSLERLDEEGTLSLAGLRGKGVVVNFWASWCIPCKDEAPFLQEVYARERSSGLVVIGVDSQDFKQDARAFMKRFGITYPVVYDGKGATLGAWGVVGFPETFFVDRNGMLVGERIQGGVDVERNREAFDRGVELALAEP
ncbi:MAG: TlpA family protein disulfide reductase [Thermoleophilia bacterium]|nr:TlpA family protein disulfide reductase [Thermoleophilia bacterium]